MSARVIDGSIVAAEIHLDLRRRIAALSLRGVVPGLAVVLVGDNPGSVSYVRGKTRDSAKLGIYSETFTPGVDVTQKELLALIDELNSDARFHGILVQLPLPEGLDEAVVTEAVDPRKDVDGLHPVNLGKLLRGDGYLLPCTAAGVQQLLLRGGYEPSGRHVVICGRSNLVGKPLAAILMQKNQGANATVTVCHTGTADLASVTRGAEILVVAMGSPRAITAEMVRPGAVVIDVGVNRMPDASKRSGFRLVGDVDYDALLEVAEAITPVPGGVGPMTRTMLAENTVTAAERQTSDIHR